MLSAPQGGTSLIVFAGVFIFRATPPQCRPATRIGAPVAHQITEPSFYVLEFAGVHYIVVMSRQQGSNFFLRSPNAILGHGMGVKRLRNEPMFFLFVHVQ